MTTVRAGLIQMNLKGQTDQGPDAIREAMLAAHLPLIDQAGADGVQVLCMQEICTQPYFCPSQDARWYAAAERIPDGPTTRLMQEYARKHGMVIVAADLRGGDSRRLLQRRRRDRRRRQLSRQVPQDAHPAGRRLLREVLLQARQLRLPGLSHGLLQARRLHLLRPAFSGGLARPGAERRRIHRQSLGHGRRPQPVSVEARAAGGGGRQRRLSSARSIGRAPRSHGASAVSTAARMSAIRAASCSARRARTGTSWSRPTWTWSRSARSAISGSSSATAGPRPTAA